MKTGSGFLLISLFIIHSSLNAQETGRKFLSFEAGYDGIGCYSPDKEYIRPVNDQSTYYYYNELSAYMGLAYTGVKFEYKVVNNYLGLAGGLRYTLASASIARDSYMSSNPDYFYIKYKQDGTNTYFAKVRGIKQNTGYIGIPLELRYYPLSRRRCKVEIYYKAGMAFNLKLHSKSEIEFSDEGMDRYNDEVSSVVEKTASSFSSFYLGAGLKIGNQTKPCLSIEANAPVFVAFPRGSYLLDPIVGGGIQLKFSIPIKNKNNENKSDIL